MESVNKKKADMYVIKCRMVQKKKNTGTGGAKRQQYRDILLYSLLVCSFLVSLLGIFTDAYSVQIDNTLFYAVTLILSTIFTIYYAADRFSNKKTRRIATAVVLVCAAAIGFAAGEVFISGLRGIGNDMINQLNISYSGTIEQLAGAGEGKMFVIVYVTFFVAWISARAIVDKRDNLRIFTLIFPVILISAIGGGDISEIKVAVLVLTFMIITVLSGIRKRRKFWGGPGNERYADNSNADTRIRFKVVMLNLAGFILFALIAVRFLMPVLTSPLEILEDLTNDTRVSGIRFLGEYVPKLTDGKLNFSVEGVGGGVSGGILGDIEGTFYTMEENVKVTCSSLPKETLYLRGYVGSEYTGKSWEWHDEEKYEQTIGHWGIKENAKTYIYNLPFLRMAYAVNVLSENGRLPDGISQSDYLENESGSTTENQQNSNLSEPEYITIEHMDGNISYTYTPYQSFLNDYYTILGGDCCVEGQNEYEDTFPWFETSDFKEVMQEYHSYIRDSNTYGVLDELEASYEYYVSYEYTKTNGKEGLSDGDSSGNGDISGENDESGKSDSSGEEDASGKSDSSNRVDLSALEELCREKNEEWNEKIKPDMTSLQKDDLTQEKYEDIINFVRRTLWENCKFEDEAKKLPEGKDFINYFMFELKEGDSTAFASTAVMMFRICGIPARYVEGYVVPTNIFTNNQNDEYYAVLQDDNAHAWVEIYVPYQGWTPVETTPGFDGMISNLDMPKEDEKQDDIDTADEKNEKDNEAEEEVNENNKMSLAKRIFIYLTGILLPVLLMMIIRHAIVYRRRRAKFGCKNENEKVKCIFYSFYEVLIFDGFDENIDTTGYEFKKSIADKYSQIPLEEISDYIDVVWNAHYGREEVDEKAVGMSLRMYEKLIKLVRQEQSQIRKIEFTVWKAF